MEEKNNKIFGLLLMVLALLIGLVLIRTINLPISKDNQTSNAKQTAGFEYGTAEAQLATNQTEIQVSEIVSIKLIISNLDSTLTAADFILNYDPAYLEFVEVTDLNPLFLNPRQLIRDSRLIVSFVEKEAQTEVIPTLTMAAFNFKALKAGQTTITPVLNETDKSSMIIEAGNKNNVLGRINQVQVVIK